MSELHPEELYGDLTRMELYQAIAKAEKQADEWCDQYKNKRAENIAMHISKDMDIAQLETDRDEYRNQYHMAEAKILSRDALLEQLSEEQLTQDLAKAEAENEALRLKAKHTVQMVNTIRTVMQINREHKDVFGGEVYLVDHTHMWALVRNAEDLDALLTGGDDETE